MITTTLEQSKKFVKLGINPSTADMCWCNSSVKGVNYTDGYTVNIHTVKELKNIFDETLNGWDKYWELIPAWSLEALLKILPYRIEEVIGHKTELTIFKLDGGWTVIYRDNKGLRHGPSCVSNNLIDACVEMIIKLKKENLL